MANASLHIPITGDASQFLAEVNKAVDALRKLQNEFNSALSTSGKKAKLDIDVDAVEGSIADLKQKIKSLEETRNNLSPFDLDNLEAANRQIQEYKNEVSRLQGIGVKIDIEPPPLGSIADLRDSLKKALTLRDLVSFTDTAALEQYNTTIQTLKARIKELEGVGIEVNTKPISPVLENSIAGLQQKLNSLKTAVINVDVNNEDEIARLNTQIIELEQRIARLKNLSIDPSGKVTQSANKARQSLTNLTLVAQDLPFGFIAIQNNLPNLFKSFGDLSSEAGGLKGGLKQLGKAMIGPAGLFFAFSAVTAAVTFAVNEYGSLDAAIRALTGKTTELDGILLRSKESLEKYNKELRTNKEISSEASSSAAGQVERIKILSDAVRDVTLSETQRNNALKELQQLDPKQLENIKLNAQGYKDLDKWVVKYTESLIANAVAQEYIGKIAKATVEINQQSIALQGISGQYDILAVKRKKALDIISKSDGNKELELELLAPIYAEELKLNKAFFAQANTVSNLNKQLDEYKSLLKSATLDSLNFFKQSKGNEDDTKKGTSFNFALKELEDFKISKGFYDLDKALGRLPQYAEILLDVSKSEKERTSALKSLSEESSKIFGVNSNLFANLTIGKNNYKELANAVDEYGFSLQTAILESQRFTIAINQFEPKSLKDFKEKFKDAKKEIDKFNENDNFGFLPNKAPVPLPSFEQVKKKIELDKIAKEFEGTRALISELFFDPLTSAFESFAESGKFAFDELGKSILKTINQIVSKIIATGIINLLANILFPGGGKIASALGVGVATGAGGGVGGAFKAAFKSVLGLPGQANYSNIRGNQNLAMSGNVNMVLRGNDLVGAINRTNSTINRVG